MKIFTKITPGLQVSLSAKFDLIEVSPPEVGSKQFIILCHFLKLLCQVLEAMELLSSIEHHRDDIVGQDVVELLSDNDSTLFNHS